MSRLSAYGDGLRRQERRQRPGNSLAHIVKRIANDDTQVLLHHIRNTYSGRRRNRFQTGGNVDAVTQNVITINEDVAEIDSGAVENALPFRDALLLLSDC